jgi:hypothetical protein
MKKQQHNKLQDYYRKFKISLIISLSVLTSIFYLFPKFASISSDEHKPVQLEIYVSDVPQTFQQKRQNLPPRRPRGVIPVPGDFEDLPEEITMQEDFGDDSGKRLLSSGLSPEIPPKPILEVYPSVSGVTCKGYVRLLLLINKNGITESLEILDNTTGLDTCLKLAVDAALKSKWIPAKVENQSVESWVTKTYKFNISE